MEPVKKASRAGAIARRGDAAAVEPAAGHPSLAKSAARPRRGRGGRHRRRVVLRARSPGIKPRAPSSTTPTIATRPMAWPICPGIIPGCPSAAPQLGPPLPGDLGRPILNSGAPAPGMPAGTDPEQQRIAQEQEAARMSRLFATTNVRQTQRNNVGINSGWRDACRCDDRLRRPDLAGSQARLSQRRRRPPHHEPGPRPARRRANTFCRRAR